MNVMKVVVIFASLAFLVGFGISSPTTIKINGKVYKCVDFYKQPAFRSSSLSPQVVPNLAKLQQQERVNGFGLSGGCPIGTVPILYGTSFTTSNTTFIHDDPRPPTPKRLDREHCTANVQTINDGSKRFYGANGGIAIYKAIVENSQWSSSRIKLLNGGDSIEAGWMVNPAEFKDNEAHLYASFSVAGKVCINLACSGFVQVSTDIPLGVTPHAYSTVQKQILWDLSIDKHQDDGNWWLSLNTGTKHLMGYWPKSLFTTLAEVANQVEFGGEINDPGAVNPPPAMGNGMLADYDTTLSGCIFHATVVDESHNNINPPDTKKFADCGTFYTVLDGGYHDNPDLGRLIFYGGPGPLDR